jgi:uroporphyrin-III C-methyltransferase
MYREPEPGASVLVSLQSHKRRKVLILGTNHLAAIRSLYCLEAGFTVHVLSDAHGTVSPDLLWRAEHQQLQLSPLQDLADILPMLQDATLACLLVTDTLHGLAQSAVSIQFLVDACFDLRIPINVADHPTMSDFTFPTTHRFSLAQSDRKSPLQIAVATNSSSCRLASRIKRMVVAALPPSLGQAVLQIAELRSLIKAQTPEAADEAEWTPQANTPVEQRTFDLDASQVGKTQAAHWLTLARMRFVAQICACYASLAHAC